MCFQFPCVAGRWLRLTPGYRTISGTARMTTNNYISPMKNFYNTSLTLPKQPQKSTSALCKQSQKSRSILQVRSRFLGLFRKEKKLSYNGRNTVHFLPFTQNFECTSSSQSGNNSIPNLSALVTFPCSN